jgi:CheY-like chemotaxis protein
MHFASKRENESYHSKNTPLNQQEGATKRNKVMKTILIVDDQPELRLMLRIVLEDEGFECLEASDGEMAIQLLTDHSPVDLVVTDFQMPRMHGLQLLNQLMTHPVLRKIPKIFITAENSLHLRHKAFQAGANLVLFKPLDAMALRACVQRLLTPRQAA